jgi:hypothetical protein
LSRSGSTGVLLALVGLGFEALRRHTAREYDAGTQAGTPPIEVDASLSGSPGGREDDVPTGDPRGA